MHRRRAPGPLTPREAAILRARHGTVADRFWSHVRKTSGCWLWVTRFDEPVAEYGLLTVEGRSVPVHRLSWQLHNGPIPPGMQINHTCDVRNCVRPDHLYLGTQRENMRDMVRRGRWRTGVPNVPVTC